MAVIGGLNPVAPIELARVWFDNTQPILTTLVVLAQAKYWS